MSAPARLPPAPASAAAELASVRAALARSEGLVATLSEDLAQASSAAESLRSVACERAAERGAAQRCVASAPRTAPRRFHACADTAVLLPASPSFSNHSSLVLLDEARFAADEADATAEATTAAAAELRDVLACALLLPPPPQPPRRAAAAPLLAECLSLAHALAGAARADGAAAPCWAGAAVQPPPPARSQRLQALTPAAAQARLAAPIASSSSGVAASQAAAGPRVALGGGDASPGGGGEENGAPASPLPPLLLADPPRSAAKHRAPMTPSRAVNAGGCGGGTDAADKGRAATPRADHPRSPPGRGARGVAGEGGHCPRTPRSGAARVAARARAAAEHAAVTPVLRQPHWVSR